MNMRTVYQGFLLVLTLLFLTASTDVNAQLYQNFTGYGIQAKRVKADSVLLLPPDTTFSKSGAALRNGVFYVWNGSRWAVVTGGGGGGSTDWADITNKPANFTTTYALSNDVRDSIQTRVRSGKYSVDSANFSTLILARKLANDSTGNSGYYTRGRWARDSSLILQSLASKLNLADSTARNTGYATRSALEDSLIQVYAKLSNIPVTPKTRLVCAIIRAKPDGSYEILNDADHRPINVTNLNNGATTPSGFSGPILTLGLSFTASKVLSFVITPDETTKDAIVGGSVGFSSILLQGNYFIPFQKYETVITKSGSGFTSLLGTATFNAGVITLNYGESVEGLPIIMPLFNTNDYELRQNNTSWGYSSVSYRVIRRLDGQVETNINNLPDGTFRFVVHADKKLESGMKSIDWRNYAIYKNSTTANFWCIGFFEIL